MASNGTFTNDFRTGYRLILSWRTVSQNTATNSSTVEATLTLASTGASYTIVSSAVKSGSLTINGTTYTFSFSASLNGGQSKAIYSRSVQVPHALDGTKSVGLDAEIGLDVTLGDTQVGTVKVSGTAELERIPRASTPTLSKASADIGTALTITTNRASSDFEHTLTYDFGTRTNQLIASRVGASQSWTLPDALLDELPNATSGRGTIHCETFDGATSLGVKSIEFTATVPASVVPTINAVTVSEAVDGIAAKFGTFVQGRSQLKVDTDASAGRGASLTRIKTFVENVEYRGASVTTDTVQQSGSLSMTTVLTDSRGRTAQTKTAYTVAAYQPPTISTFTAWRSDGKGTEDPTAENAVLTYAFAVSDVGGKNDKTYTIRYRKEGTEEWTDFASGSEYTMDNTTTTPNIFGADYAWEIELQVSDLFGAAVAVVDIPTAFVLMDFKASGKGVAFGKVSEKDALEIALPVSVTASALDDYHTPEMLNGWTNHSTGYEPCRVWKDPWGVVHVSGMIKGGTATAGTPILQLPEGYWPEKQQPFACVSNSKFARVDVVPNGQLYAQAGVDSTWLSLSGITFRAKEG